MGVSDIQQVPLWIDNEPITSDILFPVINSETGVTISAYGASKEIVNQAICSSYTAFESWRKTSPWERRALLSRAAALLKQRGNELAQVLKVETPIDDFTIEAINLQLSVELLEELAGQILETTKGELQPSHLGSNTLAIALREPMGVQVGIAPWNASVFLAMRAIATPIACGNTAILKASEITPLAHHFIAQLFKDAGFPPGVLNVIQHCKEDAPVVLDMLASDPRVRKLNFTGSTAVGKIVATKAAQNCKPVLLELGGKCPQIVLDDANLDKAAEAALLGAFSHHGQICMSTERIIVSEKVLSEFATKLVDFAGTIDVRAGYSLGHSNRLVELVRDSVARGAEFLIGDDIEQEGARLSPRILTKVTPDMPIWRTETFGPIALLIPFKSIEEAIELANDSDYGLSASVFSSNIPRAMEIARRLDVGGVHINSMTVHDDTHMPLGGTKNSGWGRFGVPWGFSEFTQLKVVTISDDAFSGQLG